MCRGNNRVPPLHILRLQNNSRNKSILIDLGGQEMVHLSDVSCKPGHETLPPRCNSRWVLLLLSSDIFSSSHTSVSLIFLQKFIVLITFLCSSCSNLSLLLVSHQGVDHQCRSPSSILVTSSIRWISFVSGGLVC